MIPAVFPRHHHRHSKTLCYMGPLSDTTHTHCRATSATASSDQSNRYWGFGHTAEKPEKEEGDDDFMGYLSSVSTANVHKLYTVVPFITNTVGLEQLQHWCW